jgi:hypothetical protein
MSLSTKMILVAGLAAAAAGVANADFSTGIGAGPFASNGAAGGAANGVFSFLYSGATGDYNGIRIRGTATSTPAGSFLSELRYRLDLGGGLVRDSGQLISGGTWAGGRAVDNQQNVSRFTLNSGTNYSFRFWESFNDGGDAAVDANWSNVQFDLISYVPPTPPAATNLGTFANTVNNPLTANGTLAAGEIKWFKFNVASAIGAGNLYEWLQINTNGSTLSGTNDTEIGLFNAGGDLLAQDDDGGDGFLSLLQYGNGGLAGAGLAAGEYYLAVGAFNTTFSGGFGATSTSLDTGSFQINLIPAPGAMALLGLGGLIVGRRRR